ncbi:hypothetical protein AGMMS50256_37910 [Betaproteobacteria bacterium]|nr:hypothetical protein AGMMS50256_37910 [Betaproteobacteria bacterium]
MVHAVVGIGLNLRFPGDIGETGIATLPELGRDTQIEAVGIYEGDTGSKPRGFQEYPTGSVEVRIRRSNKSVVLVLSSYEPVRWSLAMEPGARLSAVLISGYHASEVVGTGAARVIRIGSAHAHAANSNDYNVLNAATIRTVGAGIQVFQGSYKGKSFSVGGR